MPRHRRVIYAALLTAWGAFALWQFRSYQQQQRLIEESLVQQSRSIMTALIGGLRSHRRLGQFFGDQMQGMLDELVASENVVSVAIRSDDNQLSFAAGTSLDAHTDRTVTDQYQLVTSFELKPDDPTPKWSGSGMGLNRGRGGGPGGGAGGGRGRGAGARGAGARGAGARGAGVQRWEAKPPPEGPLATGGRFDAELVLDRSRAMMLARRVTWSHIFAVLAAGLVAVCIALVWRSTVNLAEAKGRERVYAAEARHLRDLGQAAAGLAHETRNPLGLLRGWTQRLAAQNGMSEDDRQEYSNAVIEECDRVTARINQFLAFARPRVPEIGSVDVGMLLQELSMILWPDLETKQLSLETDVDTQAGWLQADPELLRQSVFNLLQNAIHFAPDGSAVSVTVKLDGRGLASLLVADRGPGVPADTVESLFTPYFTTRADGTGLGLAIVRHITANHGWNINYRARVNGGAIFEISAIHVAKPAEHTDRR